MNSDEKKKRVRDVQDLLELIGGRWRASILATLCSGDTKRFSEIQETLGSITPRVLSKELKYLEMNKIIKREQGTITRNSVVYYFTEHGKTLEPLIKEIHEWARKHREIIFKGE